MIVLSSISLALAGWIYDAGRTFSGLSYQDGANEVRLLKERVLLLEDELSEARASANTSVSQLQIEKTTQDQLAKQVKRSEDESLRLKADLAMFESFLGNETGSPGMAISRFRVEPESEKGKYAYHLLVTQQGKDKGREFKGRLQFAVVGRRGGQTVAFEYPEKDGGEAVGSYVTFKYFARLDGVLRVPADVTLTSIEVRIVENGAIKARQSLTY